MAVQVVNGSGVKVALAHHLASKTSIGGKKQPAYKWPPSMPQSGTQTAIVLKLFLEGKVLTHEWLAKEHQIHCLTQIAWHLEAYHGWPIEMRWKQAVNAHGQLRWHGEYFLSSKKAK